MFTFLKSINSWNAKQISINIDVGLGMIQNPVHPDTKLYQLTWFRWLNIDIYSYENVAVGLK